MAGILGQWESFGRGCGLSAIGNGFETILALEVFFVFLCLSILRSGWLRFWERHCSISAFGKGLEL